MLEYAICLFVHVRCACNNSLLVCVFLVCFVLPFLIACVLLLLLQVTKSVHPNIVIAIVMYTNYYCYTHEQASASQMAKKKILEKLGPSLRTDDKGIAMWMSYPFTLTSGTVTAPLPNATVS